MSKSEPMAQQVYSAPEDTLIYAVGDVHGQLHLLDDLLAQIDTDAKGQTGFSKHVLVFVGDYVDRGPNSAAVIDRLMTSLPDGFSVHCLMGNHEAVLLDFLDDPTRLEHWLMNGAGATLSSYGVEAPAEDAALPAFIQCRDQFYAALPPDHLAFLRSLPLSLKLGDYFFVHAGVVPGVALDAQQRRDLLWIRDPFLHSEDDFGCIVVHGHTPEPEPVERPNRIGIDTGAWAYGRLTAVRLAGTARRFFHADEKGRV